MKRVVQAYMRTLRQYLSAPKTRYEYKHYAIWLLLYGLTLALVWEEFICPWKSLGWGSWGELLILFTWDT